MKKNMLYPLLFEPILIKKVWGGNKLSDVLGKKPSDEPIGESWELSGVQDTISIIANGPLKGKNVVEILDEYKQDLMGQKVYETFGNTFPLLFKFIDATKDLSVQLHPDDRLAKERHDSFGKTEMWYIVQADEEARIIVGFEGAVTKDEYLESLEKGAITEILHEENVTKGDSFFIKPGLIHAIGAGVLLAEIQQTSDITYRIYDWDRPDTDGRLRELHTDLALDAIDYNAGNGKLQVNDNGSNISQLKKSPYFLTNRIRLDKPTERDFSTIDSFVVYMCVEGEATLLVENYSNTLTKGNTILIPACFDAICIEGQGSTLLEIYIP
ncbi:type I phosphomannose isomerase catalytic subunit [Luteirhabdus pelagi]|uniref:type I phosphomannose isomerase catalytic subunit n=1 Tax=Luteirhabdus pelagi TaxID=2792783 RepID=UPI00193A90DC|nr:type I phosphomannose isomerase catalytic subunit [Luteirhabdus pelagi]